MSTPTFRISAWRPLVIALGLLVTRPVGAVTVPFLEEFATNDARWGGRSGLLELDYVASGGLGGGGYVSDQVSFELNTDGDSIVAFRAQDELNSSGNAFVGNWITGGVARFSTFVRHAAAEPLFFFTRFSSPFNFPGATAVRFQPVAPNTWTQLDFEISANNPAFVTFEGSNFSTVFSNIGHVQVGFDVPTGLGGSAAPITVDLDRASIVPEPSWLAHAVIAIVMAARRRGLNL